MTFAVTVLPAVAGHRWVCVEGLLDASSAADVRAVVAAALTMPTRRLTIDLRAAQVDGAGRTAVTDLMSAAAAAGIEARLLEAGSRRSEVHQAVGTAGEPIPALAG